MSFSAPVRPDMLALLYGQHQSYTAELGQTHQKLSKQYKKMSKVERVLSERQDRHLSREERKKWQYSRVLTKRNIAVMEFQQARLHDMLRQCNDLIASFEHGGGATHNSPMTPWGAAATDLSSQQLPPSPFLFTPFSPIAFSPYTAVPAFPHRPSFGGASTSAEGIPQYWDLSMLSEPQRERRLSSPYATGSSAADSGFYEPHALRHGVGNSLNEDAPATDARGHVYAHELMSPLAPEFVFGGGDSHELHSPISSATSGITERDQVPDLVILSPAKLGASTENAKINSHKRCYSENAIQLDNDSHLATPVASSVTKRGTSVGPAPVGRKIMREDEQCDGRQDVGTTTTEE
ncbi:uncharacterized protein MYCFIDRAFT_80873 [Pseudocercospora fijiensis CIRAD86]|uniref:Uncharacterized protein n=1 Tax=Pseudocercospora fijiensis (strain CIRAD86) TaxID=383855 RepID=M3AMV0_PSEFD|nr:uncharacterized protein MYCFIDRAFT_80873 [Pseudocercospora fijiensis CIRAD86]EME78458.1 hypothetical protein MYCFIDRAFT_80873 [Pseudocercospora fijiensis CIRAD86]